MDLKNFANKIIPNAKNKFVEFLKAASKEDKRLFVTRISFALLSSLLCIGFLFAFNYSKVTVVSEGIERNISTFSDDIGQIVSEAGFKLEKGDKYIRDGKRILLYKSHEVVIDDGIDEPIKLRIAGNVSDALKKAKVTLGEKDTIEVPLATIISSDFTIKIHRAFTVLLKVDGKKIYTDISRGTVLGLLKSKNITIGNDDKINVKITQKLKEGMKIVVNRITFGTEIKAETIPFETTVIENSEMYSDEQRTIQKGENGSRDIYYFVKYSDGEAVKRHRIATVITKSSTAQIVEKGTKRRVVPVSSDRSPISVLTPPNPIELDSDGRPKNYKKLIVGEATAYAGGSVCSTGVAAIPGRVAVDPREIPYGTKMYIVSCDGRYVYGYAVAADTGGFIYNSRTVVDLRFTSEAACERFGRRNVEIYILP